MVPGIRFCPGEPVLIIDTPRKVNNPRYEELALEPMEAAIRNEIGEVLPLSALADAPEAARRQCDGAARCGERLAALREKWIFNGGSSDAAAAARLLELAERP